MNDDLKAALRSGDLTDEQVGRVIFLILGVKAGRVESCVGADGSPALVVREDWEDDIWSGYRRDAPDRSLDAAAALIDRRWPGCRQGSDKLSTECRAYVGPGVTSYFETAPTEPLARLLAAVIAAEGEG